MLRSLVGSEMCIRDSLGTTPVRERTGQCHATRSRQEDQSPPVFAGAMLGHVGGERAEQRGPEICAADGLSFSAGRGQSQQADPRAGTCLLFTSVAADDLLCVFFAPRSLFNNYISFLFFSFLFPFLSLLFPSNVRPSFSQTLTDC